MQDTTLSANEEEFARAVRANNYCDMRISPSLVLITDWEEDEEFKPWIAVEEEDVDEEDIVEEMEEIDVFDFEDVEIEEQEGVSIRFGEFSGVEFNRWAEDIV